MKRIVCLILSVLFVISFAPVFAAESEGLQKAILIVKSRIDIPNEYSEFSSDVLNQSNGMNSYRLEWSTPKEENKICKRISVSIDDYGNIYSYSNESFQQDYYNESKKLPKFSNQQLKEIGYDFFKKLNPDLAEEFLIDKASCSGVSINSSEGYVTIPRYVSGVRYSNDKATVCVSASDGEVQYMNVSLTYCNENETLDGIISAERAAEAYNALSPMELQYVSADAKKAVPVYKPKNYSVMVSAANGEKFEGLHSRINNAADVASSGGGSYAAEAAAAGDNSGFTQQEQIEIDQVEGLLSKEELNNIAMNIENTDLALGQLQSCKYSKQTDSFENVKYIADLFYTAKDENEEYYMSLTLDAKSGELEHYREGFHGSTYTSPKYSEAQALEIAKAFAEKYAGDIYANITFDREVSDKILPNRSDFPTYYFSFKRQINGIPYNDNYLSINVDDRTGAVTSFYKDWRSGIEFEPLDGVISPDTAFDELMKFSSMELSYQPVRNSNDSENVEKMALVYSLDTNTPYVSAKTGEHVSYDGTPFKAQMEPVVPSDISGHYAESQITALISSEVIKLSEGETVFRPDDAITQGELLAFVESLKGTYPTPLEYDIIYDFARSYGLIKAEEESDGSALCKREDGAKYIIRAIGYDNIAQMSDIFNVGFADENMISDGMKGYVALAKGFGVIGGNPDNTFAPQEQLTRADAAIMIYNYLTR